MRVFLYGNTFDFGIGDWAVVRGFELVIDKDKEPEAVKSEDGCVYGRIYNVDNSVMESLDAYHGIGIGLHERITVTAILEGNRRERVFMYEMCPQALQR